MASDATLLIEVGTEELPPDQLSRLSQAFTEALKAAFDAQQIPYTQCENFATPRRIAARFQHVPSHQPDRSIKRKGPAVAAAYDAQGNPTPALLGFCKSCGIETSTLKTEETPQGAWVFCEFQEPGKALTALLPAMVENAIQAIPAKKKMRWGSGDLEFLRPIHWVCIVHGDKPLAIPVFNLTSSNQSMGHPVHAPGPVTITSADDYLPILRDKQVIADYQERLKVITDSIQHIANQIHAKAVVSEHLLNQINGLVEWPAVYHAKFDKAFLAVPQEALMSSMQTHQKCIPLQSADHKLLPDFLLVSNIAPTDHNHIIRGNERVMKARLEDAKFFFEQDKKTPLSTRLAGLEKMIFQKSLGTLSDKVERIVKLSSLIAQKMGGNVAFAERAAKLCKADLLTEMVFEFPELQGIMGRYYAQFDGEPAEVCEAIQDSYLPRFAKDAVPTTPTAICVALADRLDTLVGIFGIGQAPTGDKDPFALRRQALAVMRILIENALPLDLAQLLSLAQQGYGSLIDPAVIAQIQQFCFERFKAWELEQGVPIQVIDAVMANPLTIPYDAHRRLLAVNQFLALPQAEHLSQANKRVRNILQKSSGLSQFDQLPAVDPKLLQENQEKTLFSAIQTLETQTKPLIAQAQYQEALSQLASLQQPVDDFFDAVMVMSDDASLKQNRLNLLSHLLSLFMQIADVSRLAI